MKDYEMWELAERREILAKRLAMDCQLECYKEVARLKWKTQIIEGATAHPRKGQTLNLMWREELISRYVNEAAHAIAILWRKYRQRIVDWERHVVAGGDW